MKDLKEKTIRGGFARMCAQAANFLLRFGSLVILARLLGPKDFGLVGMVTAFTGVLNLFRDFGLSSAAIQRNTVTEEQISTLFWINILVGAILGLAAVALAPAVAAFYHEPRLLAVMMVLAAGFVFNAAGVQHVVLLQRQMRFSAMAVINTIALIVGTAIAMFGAKAGYGYWALVAMTVSVPLISTIGFWIATGWIPGMPQRGAGVRSMMRFGGTLTLNGLVVYIANNMDKVLLGRFWGVNAVGIYGRAYQLINIPTDNLNSAVGEVAFSALSRVQDDPPRLRSYFLKGYSLVLALTLPITTTCALFAEDVTFVLLGPKWKDAATIFRLLSPTILVFAIANPLSWVLSAMGLVGRNLKIALLIAPTMIAGYALGLPYGAQGVAFGYSAVLTLWLVPLCAWCVHGTVISLRDVWSAVNRPLAASIVAGVVAFGARLIFPQPSWRLGLLVFETAVLLITYVAVLLIITGRKSVYFDLYRELTTRSAPKDEALISA
jgi:O-antigen/teichoic acid export membrane protein